MKPTQANLERRLEAIEEQARPGGLGGRLCVHLPLLVFEVWSDGTTKRSDDLTCACGGERFTVQIVETPPPSPQPPQDNSR